MPPNLLPPARGPISEWVFRRLRGRPTSLQPNLTVSDPLVDDDLHLTLHCLYDLAYRPFADVDPGCERDPLVVTMRNALEHSFWAAVRDDAQNADGDRWARLASHEGPGVAVEAMLDAFDGPSLSEYMLRCGTRRQFQEFLAHRSAYQLKEADPHTMGLARLAPGARKSAMVEIQFDEYGHGRAGRSHAELFADAMRDAGLDDAYGRYVEVLPGSTLATGNLLSMFATRRELVAHLIGHLALFEMTSVVPMGRYAEAATRLGFGPAVRAFYDVHVEADEHHGSLGRRVLLGDGDGDEHIRLDLVLGAHALLRTEDRFARAVLGRWASGRPSLRVGRSTRLGDAVEDCQRRPLTA